MATITQTVEEFVTKHEKTLEIEMKPKKVTFAKNTCPADCSCRVKNTKTPLQIMFNAIGIIIAILATYLIVSTDSKLYLVFWVGYSILRKMMKKKNEKTLKIE
ncbi:hypothetical protein O3G_MSEX011573 [Manduca sexta]|uniref:Uncharacterized protein n=1 Tax=Manduca sexta TaxID=7130 RepID=A0A922CVF1_MANSE|nr:hypothetical protein O3G_MSEX011573 [Manduca sexta]